MADQKISELTALTGANLADVDAFAVVDTSAVQTKKITYAELKTALDTGTGFVRISGDTMTGTLVAPTINVSGNIDVDGISNLDVVDIDGAVDMASTLTLAGNADFNGDLDVDGTSNLDVVDIDGAVDMASTLAVGGVVTANAGVVVDNITIDGTEIDLSSGDLTLNVAGDIILDADSNNWRFQDSGTSILEISKISNGASLYNAVADASMHFRGNDGGSAIQAMTIDYANGGRLGIGSTSPNRLLSLKHASQAEIGFKTGSVSNGALIYYNDSEDQLLLRAEESSDSITFQTGGTTERARIDSSGHFLIGTTTEGASGAHNLTVADSGNAGITIRSGTSSSSAIYMSDSTSGAGEYAGYISYSHSSNAMTLATGSSGAVTIDSSGNVGIGTTSGDVTSDGNAARTYVGIIGTANRGRLNLGSTASNGADSGTLSFVNGANELGVLYMDTNAGVQNAGKMYMTATDDINISSVSDIIYKVTSTNSTSGHHIFKSYNTEIMRIDGQHNRVGINTSVPDNPLEVVGADSGIKISAPSSNRPMLRFECGSDEKLILSSNTTYGAIGDASDANRYMAFNGGKVLIGKTAHNFGDTGFEFHSEGVVNITRDNERCINLNRINNGGGHIVVFHSNGSDVGSIDITTSATSYNTSSDYRLKENVDYTWDATTRLKQLKPARFNFIADDTNTLVDGFLAHEVSSIVPEAITGTKDAVDADGNPEYQGIDQSKLVPLLVKTIQELEARIAALET